MYKIHLHLRLVSMLLFLCFWHAQTPSYAQNTSQINELKTKLKEVEGAEKVRTLNLLAKEWMYDDFEQARSYAKESLKQAKSQRLDTLEASIYNVLGDIYYLKSIHDSAQYFYENGRAHSVKIDYPRGIAEGLAGLGMLLDDQNEFAQAIEKYSEAYNIHERHNDTSGMTGTLNNIGMIYYKQDQFDKSIKYLKECLAYDEARNDQSGIGYSCTNIGMICYQMGDNEQALSYLKRSLEVREKLGNQTKIASVCNNIGNVLVDMSKFDEGQAYYLRALKIKRTLGNDYDLAITLNNLGNFEMVNVKDYPAALQYLVEARFLLSKTNQLRTKQENFYYLSKTYEAQGNIDSAYACQSKYVKIKDSLTTEKKNLQIAEMSEKFDSEQKEKQIKIQQLTLENNEVQMDQQRTMNLIYLVGGAAILSVLVLVVIGFVQKRRDNEMLKEQKYLIEEKNEELNQQNEEIIAISEQIEYQNGALKHHNNQILASISYAKRIQESILPSDAYFKQSLPESFVLYKPKDVVSGDFYWMARVENCVFWAAVDCTGHGVPGAFMSIVGANGLKKIVLERNELNPAVILNQLTDHVIESIQSTREGQEVKDGMDIALCCLDLDTKELKYAGAYNPLWIIRKNGTEVEQIKGTKRPIGRFNRKIVPEFENHTMLLNQGDQVYIFSDGYADQFGGNEGLKFGSRTMRSLLLDIASLSMQDQLAQLEKTHKDWRGRKEEQLDDICVIGVRV